jgi:hypothetical protein
MRYQLVLMQLNRLVVCNQFDLAFTISSLLENAIETITLPKGTETVSLIVSRSSSLDTKITGKGLPLVMQLVIKNNLEQVITRNTIFVYGSSANNYYYFQTTDFHGNLDEISKEIVRYFTEWLTDFASSN